jgi:transposase
LQEFGVEQVAMESTGVYWKPVWNVLESHFQIVLANAQHIKAVPGRKTDTKDCQWIAELLQHGLLRGSFIPPLVIRDLRDLTRARTSLSQEHSRIASRIQKVLEDANLKLASVASNTLGKSGRAMLAAIIGGEQSCERLADLALGHLRAKIPQLRAALEGQVRDHHRVLLQSLLRQLYFIETENRVVRRSTRSTWATAPGLGGGRCLPRKQRERRQTDQQQDPERQSLVTSYGVSIRMGRGSHQEHLSFSPV